MDITLTITGGSAAEVKEAIRQLSESYTVNGNGQLLDHGTAAKQTKQTIKTETPVPTPAASTQPAEAPAPAATGKVTIEDIRKAMSDKNKEGKREQMKGLLAKYGAADLTSLDTKHYDDLLNDINAA